jgi:hypothetical protein
MSCKQRVVPLLVLTVLPQRSTSVIVCPAEAQIVSTFMEKLHFVECLTNSLAQSAGDTEQKVKDCEYPQEHNCKQPGHAWCSICMYCGTSAARQLIVSPTTN